MEEGSDQKSSPSLLVVNGKSATASLTKDVTERKKRKEELTGRLVAASLLLQEGGTAENRLNSLVLAGGETSDSGSKVTRERWLQRSSSPRMVVAVM